MILTTTDNHIYILYACPFRKRTLQEHCTIHRTLREHYPSVVLQTVFKARRGESNWYQEHVHLGHWFIRLDAVTCVGSTRYISLVSSEVSGAVQYVCSSTDVHII